MRALTLTQPWAGLVASGIKPLENRPRRMIKREDFGKPFAVHASRTVDNAVYDRIREVAPELVPSFANDSGGWSQSRITSAVIAVATIEREIMICGEEYQDALAFVGLPWETARWAFGPVVYVLRDVQSLRVPVPCRGWQGFWTLPDDVAAAVEGQIGSPA